MASGNDDPTEAGEQAWRQIGQQLREARVARNEDLRSIATYLRIRYSYLVALEGGDLAGLPGQPYASGFLRSYANHLALDGESLVARLRDPIRSAGSALQPPGNRQDGSRLRASMLALVALLLAGTLLVSHRGAELPLVDWAMMAAPAALPSTLPPPRPLDTLRASAAEEQSPLAMLHSVDSDDDAMSAGHHLTGTLPTFPRPRR